MEGADPDWKQACLTMFQMLVVFQGTLEKLDAMSRHPPPAHRSDEMSAEEKERRRSLVVSGLAEPTSSKPSERLQDDREAIVSMLDYLNVEALPVAVYRLPARANANPGNTPTRPRLLKVVLATNQQQRQVLMCARKLKDLPHFRGTYIRPSMTPEERKRDYELRQAAKKLRESGKHRVHVKNWELYVAETAYDPKTLEPLNA